MNSNCSNLVDLRKLQEQVKKAFCYQKLFWPFTVWINCSSDLKNFEYSRPSASNFKSFSQSLEFFFPVSQNNFENKIPVFCCNAKNHPGKHELLLCSLYITCAKKEEEIIVFPLIKIAHRRFYPGKIFWDSEFFISNFNSRYS